MSLVTVLGRLLGVLALTVGLVTMHAVAGGHDTHAIGHAPVAADHLDIPTHDIAGAALPMTGPWPALEAPAVSPSCHDECTPAGGAVALACVMVLTAATLLLLPSGRTPGPSPRRRPPPRLLSLSRPVFRPPRPPSLSVLCISRT